MKEFIRKADVILLIVLVVVGLASSALLSVHGNSGSGDIRVVIKSGGSVYACYPLSEDRTLDVPAADKVNHNTVTIEDGKVSVSEASCKNQVCVRHGEISKPGETIVCLPNRLVVSIEAEGKDKGGGYDSVTS